MTDVLCLGEVLVDMLPEKNNLYRPCAGGAPANVAVAVAKLGGKAGFIGGIAKDHFGQFLLGELQQYDVDVTHVKLCEDRSTAMVMVTLDEHGERSFQFYRHNSADQALYAKDIDVQAFTHCRILHLCSNSLTCPQLFAASLRAIELAKAQGKLVSFDFNLRLSLWSSQELEQLTVRVEQVIALADLVKFSREELNWLAWHKGEQAEFLLQCYATGHNLLLITNAGEALEYRLGQRQEFLPVPEILVVDTTAAGDAFVGALLFQISELIGAGNDLPHLLETQTLEPMLAFASLCGAYACTQKGAFSALPYGQDVQ